MADKTSDYLSGQGLKYDYHIICMWQGYSQRLDCYFNTLRPGQNGCIFADDIFKRIFFNENVWISITISLKFVPINNIPELVQIMAWRRPGDKPLFEPMLVGSVTHICVTRPQRVKEHGSRSYFHDVRTVCPSQYNQVGDQAQKRQTYVSSWCLQFCFGISAK